MLLRFSIENWMSFRDPTTFSMIASQERQHGARVPTLKKFQTRVLPIATIYGGNASGKTNFFKALNFVKKLVVEGTQPDSLIPLETFRLDSKKITSPTHFLFELLIDEVIYAFSFVATQKEILEEKLVKINSTSEKILYHRNKNTILFDKLFQKNQFLQFAFKGTRDNQLFLNNSVSQKVENFKPIYDWFKDNLELVAPDFRFAPFEQFIDENHKSNKTMNKMLQLLDTGINRLSGEEIPFENLPIPSLLKAHIQTNVQEGMTINLRAGPMSERYIITRKDGGLIAKKLVTFHLDSDGNEVKFDVNQESDGSQRTIDLLPAFEELSKQASKKVYVIDEIDRSLHTLLTRSLIEYYLSNCSTETRMQLLLTTHDVLLMDQHLLRRDEMWVAERNNGISELIPFSEYQDVRYDKDIRKSYLQGRLGGIPRILLEGNL